MSWDALDPCPAPSSRQARFISSLTEPLLLDAVLMAARSVIGTLNVLRN